MSRISFKGKIRQVYNVDDSLAWEYIAIPKLERKHCDMNAMRKHPKLGGIANSDLFPNALARIQRDLFKGSELRLDRLPEGVSVDTSGFLAVVSFEV
jgi:hypothetical protein